MSETGDKKTIRVISFSGKKSEWPIWEEKFLARAARKKYKDVLGPFLTCARIAQFSPVGEKKNHPFLSSALFYALSHQK